MRSSKLIISLKIATQYLIWPLQMYYGTHPWLEMQFPLSEVFHIEGQAPRLKSKMYATYRTGDEPCPQRCIQVKIWSQRDFAQSSRPSWRTGKLVCCASHLFNANYLLQNAISEVERSDVHRTLAPDRLHMFHGGVFPHHLWEQLKQHITDLGRDALNKVDAQ